MFTAVGCGDVEVPSGALFKHTETGGVVTCKNSESHWLLTCENNQWKGVIGNCTEGIYS